MHPPTPPITSAELGSLQSPRAFSHRDQTVAPKLLEWPTHFEGAALHLAEPTEFQRGFASDFPNDSATFRTAGRQVILRRATRGTRRLQAFEPYLRSNGYQVTERKTETNNWLTYYASNGQETLHIREQITDGHKTWSSPSPWFWHATLNPKSGPWLAATVITPVR